MSKEALAKVVQRSISDAAFRRQLATDPTGALRGYDLSADERAALRSGASGKLTSFGIDQRMSKAFTMSDPGTTGGNVNTVVTSDLSATTTGGLTAGDGAAGSAMLSSGDNGDHGVAAITTGGTGATNPVIPADPSRPDFAQTSGSEPRDVAPADIGTYNGEATGAVQSPDAFDRNLAVDSGDGGAMGAVQSPDAIDRNFVTSGGSVEPRDIAPTDIGTYAGDATGAVQSPDAIDRNFLVDGGSTEPRDVAPTDIGTYAGDVTGAVQSPDALDRNIVVDSGSAEPNDIAPTDIGTYAGDQSLSSVMASGADQQSTSSFDAAAQDEGFLPTVGYADDGGLAGGAEASHESGEGPEISQ